MAILQVYQAKVSRDPQKGDLKPEMMRELRSVTDYALRATKVMEGHRLQALGWAMSTLVVQEHNLLLTLMEIQDAKKVRYPKVAYSGTLSKSLHNRYWQSRNRWSR